MIIDTLENAEKLNLGPRFAKAFAWLKDPANAALPAGHHVIETAPDGTETLFANVQEYDRRAVWSSTAAMRTSSSSSKGTRRLAGGR